MPTIDEYRNSVLDKISEGKSYIKLKGVTYLVNGKKVHIKGTKKGRVKFPFNINPTVLEADYEVYICGSDAIFYVIPIDVIKTMHYDSSAMSDNLYPGYTVVDIYPQRDRAVYGIGGKWLDISQYRNQSIHVLSEKTDDFSIKDDSDDREENYTKQNRFSGQDGEGEDHRILKEWVANNPGFLGINNVIRTEVETHLFPSNDLPDIVFYYEPNRYAAIEIETNNPLPGVYQAIKYKVLLCAELGLPLNSDTVEAIIVAWEFPESIKNFCKKYGIKFFSKKL